MPIRIIHQLEVIQINHEQQSDAFLLKPPADFNLCGQLVAQTGQAVCLRHFQKILLMPFLFLNVRNLTNYGRNGSLFVIIAVLDQRPEIIIPVRIHQPDADFLFILLQPAGKQLADFLNITAVNISVPHIFQEILLHQAMNSEKPVSIGSKPDNITPDIIIKQHRIGKLLQQQIPPFLHTDMLCHFQEK